MSKIGKFLNLKGFHPSNFRNQERVWQKENEQKKRRKLEDEREKELKKEADMQAYNRLQKQMGLKDDSLKDSVRFMYQAPQGADQAGGGNDSEDDAVKAFKRRMAERQGEKQQGQGPAPGEEGARGGGGGGGGGGEAAAAAGGAGGEGLKYGPGELTTGEVSATYKGVGKEQKAGAQCLRCKAYGHHSGDRDCPLRGDAAAADAERRLREDPLTHIAAQVHRATAEGVSTEGPGGRRRQLVLRERALPRELAAASGIYSAGGAGIVLSSDDDAAAGEEEEGGERALGGGGGGSIGGPRFDVAGLDLGSLSQAEKRLLLKKIRRMEAGEEGAPSSSSSEEEGGGKKKRRKKDKKKKKSKKAKEEKKKKKKTKKKKKKKEHL